MVTAIEEHKGYVSQWSVFIELNLSHQPPEGILTQAGIFCEFSNVAP
jgi:hypothetical protein